MLRALTRTPDFSSNIAVMEAYLRELALAASYDVLRQDFQILSELNCVELTEVKGILCARLTRYGHEVAEGLHKLDPILHPGPDCPY
jgi:hypothetical protein